MAKLAFMTQPTKKDSSTKGGSVRDKQESHNDREARIAARAFQLFEQRGWQHGYHYQDWLQAENELYGSMT